MTCLRVGNSLSSGFSSLSILQSGQCCRCSVVTATKSAQRRQARQNLGEKWGCMACQERPTCLTRCKRMALLQTFSPTAKGQRLKTRDYTRTLVPHRLEASESLRLRLADPQDIETYGLRERTALADGDFVTDRNAESRRAVNGDVLVALLVYILRPLDQQSSAFFALIGSKKSTDSRPKRRKGGTHTSSTWAQSAGTHGG